MKLISLSILIFLTLSAVAQAPGEGDKKVKESQTEQAQPKQDTKVDDKPSVESPAKKHRIPEQLDIFLPVVTNKYEPTA